MSPPRASATSAPSSTTPTSITSGTSASARGPRAGGRSASSPTTDGDDLLRVLEGIVASGRLLRDRWGTTTTRARSSTPTALRRGASARPAPWSACSAPGPSHQRRRRCLGRALATPRPPTSAPFRTTCSSNATPGRRHYFAGRSRREYGFRDAYQQVSGRAHRPRSEHERLPGQGRLRRRRRDQRRRSLSDAVPAGPPGPPARSRFARFDPDAIWLDLHALPPSAKKNLDAQVANSPIATCFRILLADEFATLRWEAHSEHDAVAMGERVRRLRRASSGISDWTERSLRETGPSQPLPGEPAGSWTTRRLYGFVVLDAEDGGEVVGRGGRQAAREARGRWYVGSIFGADPARGPRFARYQRAFDA